jgi:hypothetical protein
MAETPDVTPPEDEAARQVPLVWIDADDFPVSFCNHMLFQLAGPGEYVLTFGHVVPPPILGSVEERLEQAKRISFVPVKTVARVSLTRQRVDELIQVLQTVLEPGLPEAGDQGK